jgi:hypothetical protein
MILDEGLSSITNTLSGVVSTGQWGTGTALPTPTDTGLLAPVASTLVAVTSSVSGQSVQFEHILNSAAGSGNTLNEFGITLSDGSDLTRAVGGGIIKTTSFQLTTIANINLLRS